MGEIAQGDSSRVASNCSDVPLDNGQTFTGEWVDVTHVDSLIVAVATDQDGVYSVQFSTNKTDVDSTLARYYWADGRINAPHRFTCTRTYARIVFTNDSGSNQTYFRLQTIVGTKQVLNTPLDVAVSQDYDATIVRPTIAQDEIDRGLRQGVTNWNKFAYRDSTTAAAGEQTIWSDTTNFVVMTTAQNFVINYNNATDGLGTTGALSLLFTYIDENELPQTATHVLGNTGQDVTSFTGLGINRVVVLSSGTANTNTNTITITDSASPGNTQAHLPAGGSVTQQAIFHVPAGHTAVAKYLLLNTNRLGGGSNPKVTFKGYVYNRGVETQYEIFRYIIDTQADTHIAIDEPIGFPLTARDVLYFVMDTDLSNTVASCRFSLNLYRNVGA